MRWTWDHNKNRTNKRTHGLSFETAQLVFDDPLAASRRDPYPDEQRWQTIGMVRQRGRDRGPYLAQTRPGNRGANWANHQRSKSDDA